jgi:hypothetical protein
VRSEKASKSVCVCDSTHAAIDKRAAAVAAGIISELARAPLAASIPPPPPLHLSMGRATLLGRNKSH